MEIMSMIENEQMEPFLKKIQKDGFALFDTRNGVFSFKKFFLPPAQKMFQKSGISGKIITEKPLRKFILFGLNQIDLSALTYLDEIMSRPYKDFFYFQNRKRAIIIGLIRENSDSPSGGDLIFQKISSGNYNVFTNTKIGKKFIEKYDIFFKQEVLPTTLLGRRTSKDTEESLDSEWQKEMHNLLLNPEALKDAVEHSRESKIWQELAEICLGCGICSYVCPLCYCFSLEDRVELNGNCFRCRKWTSCVLPEFARISGGHNFRATLKDRYYNWFYHKFVRGYFEFGKSECVGCEKCKIN